MRTRQIEIVPAHHFWVNFRDETDLQEGLGGRYYKDPTPASIQRLAQLANSGRYRVRVEFEHWQPSIYIESVPDLDAYDLLDYPRQEWEYDAASGRTILTYKAWVDLQKFQAWLDANRD